MYWNYFVPRSWSCFFLISLWTLASAVQTKMVSWTFYRISFIYQLHNFTDNSSMLIMFEHELECHCFVISTVICTINKRVMVSFYFFSIVAILRFIRICLGFIYLFIYFLLKTAVLTRVCRFLIFTVTFMLCLRSWSRYSRWRVWQ